MGYQELINDFIGVLKKHEIINENSLRDFRIRQRYLELMKKETNNFSEKVYGASKKCREILRNELLDNGIAMDDKMIQRIVYRK